jgi:hypothetical protein
MEINLRKELIEQITNIVPRTSTEEELQYLNIHHLQKKLAQLKLSDSAYRKLKTINKLGGMSGIQNLPWNYSTLEEILAAEEKACERIVECIKMLAMHRSDEEIKNTGNVRDMAFQLKSDRRDFIVEVRRSGLCCDSDIESIEDIEELVSLYHRALQEREKEEAKDDTISRIKKWGRMYGLEDKITTKMSLEELEEIQNTMMTEILRVEKKRAKADNAVKGKLIGKIIRDFHPPEGIFGSPRLDKEIGELFTLEELELILSEATGVRSGWLDEVETVKNIPNNPRLKKDYRYTIHLFNMCFDERGRFVDQCSIHSAPLHENPTPSLKPYSIRNQAFLFVVREMLERHEERICASDPSPYVQMMNEIELFIRTCRPDSLKMWMDDKRIMTRTVRKFVQFIKMKNE